MTDRISEIEARLKAATPGRWVYDPDRHTHDCVIHVADRDQSKWGYYDLECGGVVGSSEWIWLSDEDGEFIAHSKEDIEWLLGEVKRLTRLVGFT